MWSLLSNGCPVLTSRCISLSMTATEESYRYWSSCFLYYLYAAASASPAMTSTLKWHTCWSTVLKSCRTAAGDFIAQLWWRWHTQHLNLGRRDLNTSCFCLVSLMHLALGLKESSVVPRSLPSTANERGSKCQRAAQPIARAILWLFFLSFCQTWPQRLLHVHFCHHLIPIKGEYILRSQFLRGLTGHCFCSNDIPLSHSHQATPFHLLISCQPLPSISHAHSCFPRIL